MIRHTISATANLPICNLLTIFIHFIDCSDIWPKWAPIILIYVLQIIAIKLSHFSFSRAYITDNKWLYSQNMSRESSGCCLGLAWPYPLRTHKMELSMICLCQLLQLYHAAHSTNINDTQNNNNSAQIIIINNKYLRRLNWLHFHLIPGIRSWRRCMTHCMDAYAKPAIPWNWA